jgi:hypothetical protein
MPIQPFYWQFFSRIFKQIYNHYEIKYYFKSHPADYFWYKLLTMEHYLYQSGLKGVLGSSIIKAGMSAWVSAYVRVRPRLELNGFA